MKNYSIFIFTIYNEKEGDYTISQVYARSNIRAFMALALITGANDCDIQYINQETTTMPLNYGNLTNKISLKN